MWNGTIDEALPLGLSSALVRDDLQDAVREVDMLITMVRDDPAVGDMPFDRGAALPAPTGCAFVDMSSILRAEVRGHARRFAGQHGAVPVLRLFGRTSRVGPVSTGEEDQDKEQCWGDGQAELVSHWCLCGQLSPSPDRLEAVRICEEGILDPQIPAWTGTLRPLSPLKEPGRLRR